MLGRLLRDLLGRQCASTPASRDPDKPADSNPGVADRRVWQLDELNCLVNGRHGWFLANRYDVYLGHALIRYGECCEIEHRFLRSLLRPGDNIIEVGANIGVHTVGLAKGVGPQGSVNAIEAQPAIFRVLCGNLALNRLANVAVHACGCGNSRKVLIAPAADYSEAEPHNSGGISLVADGPGLPVPIVPLDDLVRDIPTVRLIKVDVEGMELEVLEGAKTTITKHRPMLYVENDRVEKSKALIEYIKSQGYRLWWHIPRLFNPDNYFSAKDNDYANVASCNMFCEPKETPATMPKGSLAEILDSNHRP
jgi:FkbM family methyltransferase